MRLLLLVLVIQLSCLLSHSRLHSHNKSAPLPGKHLSPSPASRGNANGSRKAVCYYTITSDPDTSLPVDLIEADICTHILIGFLTIVNGTISTRSPNDSLIFSQMTGLRDKNPHLKLMLSLGGGDMEIESFHSATSTPAARSRLVDSIIRLLDDVSFDGLDIDWEFPGWSKYLDDREHFLSLLHELRHHFDRKDRRMLLSIAVSPSLTIITVCYPDIPSLARLVDFVNLMSYDFHDYSQYFPFVEFNAPLHARSSESGLLATMNTEWSAKYWITAGVPRNKLVIGIPTYSHNYILSDGRRTRPGSPAESETFEFSYSQVCSFLSNISTGYAFDAQARVPYAFNGNFWSSFDDVASVTAKVKFILSEGYAGAMTYDLNCDDFRYKCGSRKFPLQSTIRRMLRDGR